MIQTSPRFLDCLPHTLEQEGGYSNDAHDPGGMTMDGIIQREYDVYRKAHNLPAQWVKKISDDEVHDIYYHQYWLPYCPLLPPGLDMQFFDNAVNEGSHAGVVLLQRALKVSTDGVWGPQTNGAIKDIDDIPLVITSYGNARASYYRSLRNFPYFGTGWLRRCSEITQVSLRMAGAMV